MSNIEMCMECVGQGHTVTKSKALEIKFIKRRCTNCEGSGEVPSIMNSAFLNNIGIQEAIM